MSRYRLARPFLFALDPEIAHRAAIMALSTGFLPPAPPSDPRLARHVLGLDFPNPLGMAAGFDKDAEVPDALIRLGFGFAEVGTVTPEPQPGNPRPRLFRLVGDAAIVNRLGFNSGGHAAAYRRLVGRRGRGIVGVNIGANRDSPDRVADYVAGVRRFAAVASYLAINVSSPNTPGLRDLQERTALTRLLAGTTAARDAAPRRVPLLLKIAPDLDDDSLAAIADTALEAGLDGLIVANTTLARDGISDRHGRETGGLSGRPLFARSTAVLAKVRQRVGRRMVLIGVGGIDSAETAFAKVTAGADLLQLYTALVFQGTGLIHRILFGLPPLLAKRGFATLDEAVGADAKSLAKQG